jgi:hypothetical protein
MSVINAVIFLAFVAAPIGIALRFLREQLT